MVTGKRDRVADGGAADWNASPPIPTGRKSKSGFFFNSRAAWSVCARASVGRCFLPGFKKREGERESNSILQLARRVKAKQGFEDKDDKPSQIRRARGEAR